MEFGLDFVQYSLFKVVINFLTLFTTPVSFLGAQCLTAHSNLKASRFSLNP